MWLAIFLRIVSDDFEMAVVDIGPMSICYTIWLVLSSLGENGSQPDLFKTIVTKNGAVRGRLDTTFLQEEPYYAFKGIPYAKPPIGERRFKVSSIHSFESILQ